VWHIVNQFGTVRLTPRHYIVEDLRSLAEDDLGFRGRSSTYHQLAAKRCGQAVAANSWLALVHFPEAATPDTASGVAFLARTPRGWRLWYRYR
jgi:hypothetical protein